MDIENLNIIFSQIKIPKIKKRAKTFLGISKQPNYENVCSNIYAFFFDIQEEHNLKDLFLKSLIQIIALKKETEYSFFYDSRIDIETEYTTKTNKRIDILLSTQEEAIIIENKIYHVLNNDLKDYWDTIQGRKKQGVVLSLRQLKIDNKNFINITHFEFLKHVMNNLGEYFSEVPEKYIFLLKDFYQNIINLTNPMETAELDFYYKYEPEISAMNIIKRNLTNHIKSQVENACGQINVNLLLSGKSKKDTEKRLRYYQHKENKNIMFTIIFDSLLKKEKQLQIIIEIQGDLLKNKAIFKSIDFSAEEEIIIKQSFFTKNNPYWEHFAVKTYADLKNSEIENLCDFIVNEINETNLLTIFNKITNVVNKKIANS